MGFFSKLFGNKNYDEELRRQANDMNNQAIINKQNENSYGNSSFVFKIDDVFTITGRGTIVTGRVISGSAYIGDTVVVNGISTTIKEIENFRKQVNIANVGDSVGILLANITRNQVQRGDFLYK